MSHALRRTQPVSERSDLCILEQMFFGGPCPRESVQMTVRDKRLKRPSLPDVKGTADDVMDEEEFK